MKNSTVLPENTDSDLAISTESPRGGEQLDELIKDISISWIEFLAGTSNGIPVLFQGSFVSTYASCGEFRMPNYW